MNDQTGFDRLIYERVRLGIMSALATNEELTFNELKSLFNASDGNLGAHARKLEEAGYVACTKSFEARRPKSIYRITPAGRKALLRYLEHIEAVIKATRRVLTAPPPHARRDHHGRQRPLGHPARPAAHGRPRRRARRPCARRSRWRRARASIR